MNEISWLSDVLNRNKEIAIMHDFEFINEIEQRTYLKELAIETCVNFIARTISQTDFRYMKNNERLKNKFHHALNVRPNTDQSASDFWQTAINKLIRDNEILIIPYNDQMLIADSFHREEKALYEDTFSQVTIKNFTFTEKTWLMKDVIYLTYNNGKLERFLDGLSKDYADLFGALVDASKRSYQLRGSINFDSVQGLDQEKQKSFVNNILSAVKSSTMAVFPLSKGVTYTEYANGSIKGPSVEEIEKIKRSLIDDVANLLGIPINLVHGDVADLSNAMEVYIKFCINPLLKKIEDELNAKLPLQKDESISLRGITNNNVIDKSEAVDKLVASGAFTRNEVRELFGFERADDEELDKYVITKNYETVDTLKGGDKNE